MFTAQYEQIPYIQQITFSLQKVQFVSILYSSNDTHRQTRSESNSHFLVTQFHFTLAETHSFDMPHTERHSRSRSCKASQPFIKTTTEAILINLILFLPCILNDLPILTVSTIAYTFHCQLAPTCF